MSLNRMIVSSTMKNGLCKIVTKSQIVTKFNVTESRLHCITNHTNYQRSFEKTQAQISMEEISNQSKWSQSKNKNQLLLQTETSLFVDLIQVDLFGI